MKIDQKLDELIKLLDKQEDIIKLAEVKRKISPMILDLVIKYRTNPTVDNKQKLYQDPVFLKYIQCENNINYLIMDIQNKFKRGRVCANNKW